MITGMFLNYYLPFTPSGFAAWIPNALLDDDDDDDNKKAMRFTSHHLGGNLGKRDDGSTLEYDKRREGREIQYVVAKYVKS